jgi:hypothetical protein
VSRIGKWRLFRRRPGASLIGPPRGLESSHIDIEDAIERGTRRALDEDARRQETLVRDAFVDE